MAELEIDKEDFHDRRIVSVMKSVVFWLAVFTLIMIDQRCTSQNFIEHS